MRAVRALLATLLVAVTGLPVLLAAPAARAAEPESWARVSIDAITPALPSRDEPDQKVTISGRITNTSDVELSNLQVAFWRSLDPIQTAEGMTAALDLGRERPAGSARRGRVAVRQRAVRVRPDPGARTSRRPSPSRRPSTQLELPDIDGVYLVGVHLRGRVDGAGPDVTVGRGRMFLPVVSKAPKETVRQTSIVVLTSRPSLLRPGYFLDDHLVDELSGLGTADPAAGGGRRQGHELRRSTRPWSRRSRPWSTATG